jgi:hypothetical protein
MPVFEGGDTMLLTWEADLAPDSAPSAYVWNVASVLVHSATAISSNTTHYYSPFSCPRTIGYFVAEFLAQRTFASSLRDFRRRMAFKVDITGVPT